jgi:hypothetical protein
MATSTPQTDSFATATWGYAPPAVRYETRLVIRALSYEPDVEDGPVSKNAMTGKQTTTRTAATDSPAPR